MFVGDNTSEQAGEAGSAPFPCLAKLLNEAMRRAGLNQSQVVRLTEERGAPVNRSVFNEMCNGKRINGDVAVVNVLADVLDIDPAAILKAYGYKVKLTRKPAEDQWIAALEGMPRLLREETIRQALQTRATLRDPETLREILESQQLDDQVDQGEPSP